MVIGLCLRSSDVAVQIWHVVAAYTGERFLHRVMLLLFLGAGLLVLCIKVTSSLILICVYAVNRLYVEKEQKSSLVLNRWCCAT